MSDKSKTIPFSIENWDKYKEVAEVVMKNGEKVKQLTYFSESINAIFPLIGVKGGQLITWTKEGKFFAFEDSEMDLELRLVDQVPFNWDLYNKVKDKYVVVDSEGVEGDNLQMEDPFSKFPLVSGTGAWYEIDGTCCVKSIPSLKHLVLKESDSPSVKRSDDFKVGDKVRMISESPAHGLGDVSVGDVGKIIYVWDVGIWVDFPKHKGWLANSKDLEVVTPEVERKHIIHYRKRDDNGVCPLSGITIVGVENGWGMDIYASVCSGDNFSKTKGVELALSRKPIGGSLFKGRSGLLDWIDMHTTTSSRVSNKLPIHYNTFRKDVINMMK